MKYRDDDPKALDDPNFVYGLRREALRLKMVNDGASQEVVVKVLRIFGTTGAYTAEEWYRLHRV